MGFSDEKLRMDRFASNIKNEILKGLPETEIQWMMASSGRKLKNFPRVPGKDVCVAAVLIILRKGRIFLKG